MDAKLFDTITQAVASPLTRRLTLSALLSATLGVLGVAESVARKGKKGKGNKGKKLKGCRKNADCPTGQGCQKIASGSHKCVALDADCIEDTDCPQGGVQYACDAGACVFVCLYSTDCQPGQSCSGNRCV